MVGHIIVIFAIAVVATWVIWMISDENVKVTLIGFIVALVVMGGLYTWYLTQTASGQRQVKSISSDVSGGLQRNVKVYGYDGQELRAYKGKIDIKETDTAGETQFDLNGKRTIIKGGIVIIDEK